MAGLWQYMRKRRYSKHRLALYLIPFLIGFSGVVFSQQLSELRIRTGVVILSVAVPLLVVVTLLARYRSSRLERTFLMGGVLLLFLGAVASVSDFSDTLAYQELLPEYLVDLSGFLGVFSLLLGMFVVVYGLARRGEDVEEIAERFHHLADHISEGFVLSTADGTIFQVNNQFLRMFDIKREDIIGHNSTQLAKQLNMTPMDDHIRNRAQGVASEYEVTWFVRGEERRFWFHGTPILDRLGRHTATLATVRDITELHRLSKRVERYAEGLQRLVEEQTQKLRQSEERFRQLLLTMNEGFLTLDAKNRIRFANDRLCGMLKMPMEQVLGRDIFELLDVSGRMRLFGVLSQLVSEWRQELNFVDSESLPVPVVVAVAPIPGSGEHDAVYSLVATSMAEQKQLQRQLEMRALELERLNEELRMHDRAKDSFLSNVSHELRTPLSTIQGYVEMLDSGNLGEVSAPQSGAIKVMERNVQRLIGMINEMIEFSRMEIRGVQVNYRLFSIPQLVRESLASIHPHTIAKDITVNLFTEENLALVWADREKIGQAMGILLNNAVKFTDHGGMIQVRVFSPGPASIAISISDTGIGIDPVYHKKIFDKFFQVDSSKTRRYEGTGIGLPIARGIVEAHGGAVGVESTLGKGSTFTITLPDSLLDSSVDPQTLAQLDSLHILLVDRENTLFNAIKGILQPEGCVLAKSLNGYEAVRGAESLGPQVILINDSETDLAGLETIGLLRQQPAFESTPVIVFTSEKTARLKDIRHMWSEVFFIRRPFSFRALTGLIRNACFGNPFEAAETTGHASEEGVELPQVLVVDSDPGMLDWLEAALRLRHIPCYCVATPQTALQWVAQQPPDVIFVDVDVPDAAIPERITPFRKDPVAQNIPLYAMTGLPGETSVPGVAGVLYKPFTMSDMEEVLRTVVRGSGAVSDHLNEESHSVTQDNGMIS